MIVRFKQCLIVDRHNYVPGDVADLPDEHARRLIHSGAVALHVPDVKREAILVPKTRKATKDA